MSGVTVFACGRARLNQDRLPESVHWVEMPCTGRVSVPLLLATMARGAEGVLVLGRHEQTCRLRGAEQGARDSALRADAALRMVGWGGGRIRFGAPDPGPEGPMQAVEAFVASIRRMGSRPSAPLVPPVLIRREGLDTSLDLIRWIAEQPDLRPSGTSWLREHGIGAAKEGAPAVIAGVLPCLSILAGPRITRPIYLPDVLRKTCQVLSYLGFEKAGAWIGSPGLLRPSDAQSLRGASEVFTLCQEDQLRMAHAGVPAKSLEDVLFQCAGQLPNGVRSVTIACDGTETQMGLLRAMGYQPVSVGADPLPQGFAISPDQRALAEAHLQRAERLGAQALLVSDPRALARWAMISRQGTWRSSHIRPVMACHLAQAAIDQTDQFHSSSRPSSFAEVVS